MSNILESERSERRERKEAYNRLHCIFSSIDVITEASTYKETMSDKQETLDYAL
jgi:hypothetical protein